MVNPVGAESMCPPVDASNFATVVDQAFSQIRTVFTSDVGDERNRADAAVAGTVHQSLTELSPGARYQ